LAALADVAPSPGDDLTAITLLASSSARPNAAARAVTNARLNGHTWDEIARALTTSPVEARLRFDPESRSPTRDGPTTFAKEPATLNPRGQPGTADTQNEARTKPGTLHNRLGT
jgi:hypothetical protein